MSLDYEKRIAAESALIMIPEGKIVGIGTGSTVKFLIAALSEKKERYSDNIFVPTSEETKKLLLSNGFNVSDDIDQRIALTIDGADEIDPTGNLIKGGGGALLREKIVAWNSEKFIVIADHTKYVDKLGKFKVPVEIIKFMANRTLKNIIEIGGKCRLRGVPPFVTDNGNFIVDCDFGIIDDPISLEKELDEIPGVVETGIFCNMSHLSIEGKDDKTLIHNYRI
ncbi:ribose-5-phosphate isomerase RpiA [Caldiplasma sukawensis]